jgi:uncharacterized protein YndB with AHSA1/START domain
MSKTTVFSVLLVAVAAIGILFYSLQKMTFIISVDHIFEAPVEKVWSVWNQEESIKKWWSPKGYTAPVIKNDFREGGKYLFSMQAPDGKISWNSGAYTQIIPNEKIVSTMWFSDENGNAVPAAKLGIPGEWPDLVLVTVNFKAMDQKTLVTVTETGIPGIMYVFAKMGWEQQFDKFDKLLK